MPTAKWLELTVALREDRRSSSGASNCGLDALAAAEAASGEAPAMPAAGAAVEEPEAEAEAKKVGCHLDQCTLCVEIGFGLSLMSPIIR